MTTPLEEQVKTAASTPTTPDAAAVVSLDIPGEAYLIRVERDHRDTIVTHYDLRVADSVVGSPVTPSWSDPDILIATYKLGQLVEQCELILRETFGATASVTPGIERDPESCNPSLVLRLDVPRSQRTRRHAFLERYTRDTVIPTGAPVPVLRWEYHDAVST